MELAALLCVINLKAVDGFEEFSVHFESPWVVFVFIKYGRGSVVDHASHGAYGEFDFFDKFVELVDVVFE